MTGIPKKLGVHKHIWSATTVKMCSRNPINSVSNMSDSINRFPSCHSTNSFKALQRTQALMPSQEKSPTWCNAPFVDPPTHRLVNRCQRSYSDCSNTVLLNGMQTSLICIKNATGHYFSQSYLCIQLMLMSVTAAVLAVEYSHMFGSNPCQSHTPELTLAHITAVSSASKPLSCCCSWLWHDTEHLTTLTRHWLGLHTTATYARLYNSSPLLGSWLTLPADCLPLNWRSVFELDRLSNTVPLTCFFFKLRTALPAPTPLFLDFYF